MRAELLTGAAWYDVPEAKREPEPDCMCARCAVARSMVTGSLIYSPGTPCKRDGQRTYISGGRNQGKSMLRGAMPTGIVFDDPLAWEDQIGALRMLYGEGAGRPLGILTKARQW